MIAVYSDANFIAQCLRTFGPDPNATAVFEGQGVTVHVHAAGNDFKLTLTPSTDNGTLTLNVSGVVVDKVKAPASMAERLVAHFVKFPGLSYRGGLFYLALPLHLHVAGVSGGNLFVEPAV